MAITTATSANRRMISQTVRMVDAKTTLKTARLRKIQVVIKARIIHLGPSFWQLKMAA